MTDRYAVIGHPVANSLSPFLHGQFATQTGEAIQYELINCVAARLTRTVTAFFEAGGRGLNVTLPHKKAAFLLADKVGRRARMAGAANILKIEKDGEISGDNTDGTGLVRDLVGNLDLRLKGTRVLVIGAGGAARGIIGPLLAERIDTLTIANRTYANALALATTFSGQGKIETRKLRELSAGFDLVINATSAGVRNSIPNMEASAVREAICYDLMYGPDNTPFMNWAHRNGAAAVHDGWGMLVEQAAESFHIWRGVWPETASLVAARPF
jgi:shikimate dehydrogenase